MLTGDFLRVFQRTPLRRVSPAGSPSPWRCVKLRAGSGRQDASCRTSAFVVLPHLCGLIPLLACGLVASRCRPWGSPGFRHAAAWLAAPRHFPSDATPFRAFPACVAAPLSPGAVALSPFVGCIRCTGPTRPQGLAPHSRPLCPRLLPACVTRCSLGLPSNPSHRADRPRPTASGVRRLRARLRADIRAWGLMASPCGAGATAASRSPGTAHLRPTTSRPAFRFVRSRSCSFVPRAPGLRDPARAVMWPASPTPHRSLACRPKCAPVHEPKDRGLAAAVARSCLPASRMTGLTSPPRRRCHGPGHRCPRRPSGSSARPSAAAVASARCSLGASLRIWPEDSSPTSATPCGLAGGASERVATRSLPLAPGRSTSSPAAWSWSQPSLHRPARPTRWVGVRAGASRHRCLRPAGARAKDPSTAARAADAAGAGLARARPP